MGQSVLIVNHDIMDKMKAFYIDFLTEKRPPGAVFRATPQDCSITGYRSGKVLFQGKRAEEEAQVWRKWSDDQPARSTKKPVNVEAHDYLPPNNISDLAIVGSDEVGTGDYFGPVVVVAAFVDRNLREKLEHLGIRDSKTLTDAKIKDIAVELSQIVPYSLLTLSNEKYNRLVSKGYTQTKIKAVLHNQALLNVIKKLADRGLAFDGCLVDQFTPPAQYFKAIADRPEKVPSPIYFKTKAESLHYAVASASVIARFAFLKAMDQLSEASGIILPKGAGTGVDQAASELIKVKGESYLSQVAKLHFANTEKAKKRLR